MCTPSRSAGTGTDRSRVRLMEGASAALTNDRPRVRSRMIAALLLGAAAIPMSAAGAQLPTYGVGRAPTAEEIAAWDLTIPPDGEGLPAGSGTAADGKVIYDKHCASCHGADGKDPKYYLLVGGRDTLATAKPMPTVGSFWQYATTLWSYMRRAKPIDEPGSLSADQVYAITAYLLFMNGIIGEHDVLDADALVRMEMPNRDGYVPDPRPEVVGTNR